MNEQKEAFITFVCDITQKSASTLISVANNMAANGIIKITVCLSSAGGELAAAFSAYHFLRSLSIPLVMHNAGSIESSAMLLYLAAGTRSAAPHSRFLIHPFHWTFGPSPVFLPNIREAVTSLEFDSRRYADIFNERTQGADKPLDVIKGMEREPLVIGAEEARLCGITTEAPAEITIPAGAAHTWIVDA
jgi:ATP-dependent protease ClpP protease subunit